MRAELNQGSSLDHAAVLLFSVFVCMLVAFNRGFSYLHLSFSDRPVYVSEPFLVLMAVLVWFDRRRWTAVANATESGVHLVFMLVGALLTLAVGKVAMDASRFGMEAIRQSALGYYAVTLPLSYAFFADGGLRDRLRPLIGGASVVSTLIFLLTSTGWLRADTVLLREFHGFGAFIWLGVVSTYVLATGRVNFWTHRAAAALFALHCAVGFMLAARSEFLALSVAVGGILVVRRSRSSRREKLSTALCALIAVSCFGLRFTNILSFGSQDIWRQSWGSYRVGASAVGRFVHAPPVAAPAAVPVPAAQLATGGEVRYDSREGTLTLTASNLTDPTASHSASVNNALWRRELWRLSAKAVLRYGPLFGMPAGITLRYNTFGHMSEGRVDLHNSHLAIFFRFGAVGFLVYAALMLTCVGVFLCRAKAGSSAAVFSLAALAYLAFLASFNVMLEAPYGALVYWGLLGAGLAENDLIESSKETV